MLPRLAGPQKLFIFKSKAPRANQGAASPCPQRSDLAQTPESHGLAPGHPGGATGPLGGTASSGQRSGGPKAQTTCCCCCCCCFSRAGFPPRQPVSGAPASPQVSSGKAPPAHLHPGPRRLSRAHLGEPGSAARGTSSPPRARPAAPHRSQLPAPPRPRAPHPPRGRKRAEDTPTTGRQRAGPGLDVWGGGSRLERKDLRAPNPRREPAGRPLPALLHLRVSLEFQQVQMLGHEALHSRGGHGRRPAGPGAAEIPAGPRASTHTARARAASASASGRGCGKMAAAVAARAVPVCFRRLLCACSRRGPRAAGPGAGERRAAGWEAGSAACGSASAPCLRRRPLAVGAVTGTALALRSGQPRLGLVPFVSSDVRQRHYLGLK